MKPLNLILAIFILFSCRNNGQKTYKDTSIKINGIEIESRILQEIEKEAQKDYLTFTKINWRYEEEKELIDTINNGIYFPFVKENRAKRIFNKYHKVLIENGIYLFLKNLDFDDKLNSYYDVTLISAANMFDVIKLMNTNGLNYDVTNEQVVEQMKVWDNLVKFKLVVADEDRIEAKMTSLPADLDSFVNEIYNFCPDVIEQGYRDIDEMKADYLKNKYFWLWWD